jgi:hypothetical protein
VAQVNFKPPSWAWPPWVTGLAFGTEDEVTDLVLGGYGVAGIPIVWLFKPSW